MTKKADKQIATVHATKSMDVQALIVQALEHKADAGTMKDLFELGMKIKAEMARESYNRSMSAFQAECPTIKKTKKIYDKSGGVRSYYATIEDIVEQVGPFLSKHGFSWRVDAPYNKETESIEAVCTINHIDGHSTSSKPLSMPLDPDAYMSNQQQRGSANSHAKRVSFCNAFGILTEDPDDGGKGDDVNSANKLYERFRQVMAATLRNCETIITVKTLIKTDDISGAAEAMHEIDDTDRVYLWVSPAKGGPWTTEERKIMRGDAWASVWKQMT